MRLCISRLVSIAPQALKSILERFMLGPCLKVLLPALFQKPWITRNLGVTPVA